MGSWSADHDPLNPFFRDILAQFGLSSGKPSPKALRAPSATAPASTPLTPPVHDASALRHTHAGLCCRSRGLTIQWRLEDCVRLACGCAMPGACRHEQPTAPGHAPVAAGPSGRLSSGAGMALRGGHRSFDDGGAVQCEPMGRCISPQSVGHAAAGVANRHGAQCGPAERLGELTRILLLPAHAYAAAECPTGSTATPTLHPATANLARTLAAIYVC